MRLLVFVFFSMFIFHAKAQVNELKIGGNAPDFVSLNADGKEVHLKDVVRGNKVTLLVFWASWCAPCRNEIPDLICVYKEFYKKGFSILSVSLDNNYDKWQNAINRDSMPWPHVSELNGRKEAGAILYKINALPASVLINSDGKILAIDIPGSGISTETENSLRGKELFKKVKEFIDK